MTRSEIYRVLAVFGIWRVALLVVSWLAPLWLAYDPTFPYTDIFFVGSNWPQWLYSWANFDGVHYLMIIDNGYIGVGLIQAFFPVFPMLAWMIKQPLLWLSVNAPTLTAGLLLANLAAAVFAVLWFGWVKSLAGVKIAWLSLLALLLFPTSFFLGAFYTESFFLCLVVGSWWAAGQRRWWLAGILAALAAGTRVVGVFLVPSLFMLLLQSEMKSPQDWRLALQRVWQRRKSELLAISFGVTGLLAYMLYLQAEFKDALYFFHVQEEFGGIRQEQIILYPQVLWRSIKILITVQPLDWAYLTYVQEFLAGTLGLGVILLSFRQPKWWAYSLFSLGVFLVPTLTGTFSSLPRYILASLVIFLWLAQTGRSRPWVLAAYLICSSLLLLINTVLFIQGYWVA